MNALPPHAAERLRQCPVCAGAIAPWRSKTGEGVDWRIDRCGGCGFAFVNPRPDLGWLMRYYEGTASLGGGPETLEGVLADEKASPNSTRDAEAMLKTIVRLAGGGNGKRMLDVGSGYGFFTAEAQRQGFVVESIELGTKQREISQAMTGVVPQDVPFEELALSGPAFDVVLMSQILEHAHDIGRWMDKCRALLAPGGLLAIALPNFDSLARQLLQEREPFISPPEHLNFFTANSLGRLVGGHGFRVEATEWVTRVPRASLARRLPGALVPAAALVADGVTGLIDTARMGSVLRLYARQQAN